MQMLYNVELLKKVYVENFYYLLYNDTYCLKRGIIMTIDFHVHGKITSTLAFDQEKFLLTVKEAKENGLEALALTEHLAAKNFLEGYEFLTANYNRIEDYYDVDGFKVFYGMEVTTKQELDILIIGKPEVVLSFKDEITANIKENEFIDINDLFALNIPKELLVILAHPYRDYSEFPEIESHVIDRLDAMELNSRDAYEGGMEEMKQKVTKLARKFNLPITCGSDTHYFIQVSTAQNIFAKNCNTVKEIKQEIKAGNYSINLSSELNVRVKSAIIIKKLICNK
jgi:histidinol phosphatase-like PHP family hydrolase